MAPEAVGQAVIGLALCGVAGLALVGAGVAVLLRAPRCEQCGERHADSLERCDTEPLSLRPVELKRRGVGQ